MTLSVEMIGPREYSIPEGWSVKSLGEIGDPKIGLTYKPTDVREAGTLVLRSSNVQGSRLSFDDCVYVSDEVAEGCLVHDGDLLICVRNGSRDLIGKCTLINSSAERMAFGAFMSVFRSEISGYVFHQFRSELMMRQIESHLGATINQITNASLRSFKILVPNCDLERERIVSALCDVDELIASLDALIAKKAAIKQGIMQELLTGKRRLSGFQGDWTETTLELAADVRTGPFGAQLHESDYVTFGTPIVTVEHLGGYGIEIDESVPMVSQEDAKRLSRYCLQEGDIVFSRVGSIDRSSLVNQNEDGWLFSGRLLRVRPKKPNSSQFLAYQFKTPYFLDQVRSLAVGQTMPSLNTKILNACNVILPRNDEQEAIANVLRNADDEIRALSKRAAKFRSLREAMREQLLTGRIRLI